MRFTENLQEYGSMEDIVEEQNDMNDNMKDNSDKESDKDQLQIDGSVDEGMSEMSMKSDGSLNDDMKH